MSDGQLNHTREENLHALEQQLGAKPDESSDLYFLYATLLDELDRFEEAKTAYVRVLTHHPRHFTALINIASLMWRNHCRPAGLRAYQEAAKCPYHSAYVQAQLGKLFLLEEDYDNARIHLDKALALDPYNAQAHQGLGHLFIQLGAPEAAEPHLQKGYEHRAVFMSAYLGTKPPIPILVLSSASNGNMPLSQHIDRHVFLVWEVVAEFYDSSLPLPVHSLVINAVGDADLCPSALAAAIDILKQTSAPVLNPPQSVLKTSRVANAERFSKVPGLIAPKTRSVKRSLLLEQEALPHDFTFPVLIRSPGFHTGHHFKLVEHADDLAACISSLPGDELLVIQYIDARCADGAIRKYRVMMIDGQLYPLHVAISHEWNIHYFSAEMSDNPNHRAEEAAFLEHMPEVLGAEAVGVLQHIQKTLNLDYAGIDFSMSAAGELILFETNAVMRVNEPPPGVLWDYRRPAVKKIIDAIHTLLIKRALPAPVMQHIQSMIPETMQLLVSGGDDRVRCDPKTGLNKYGCGPIPDSSIAAFGSATASTVSSKGFAAADTLRYSLVNSAHQELPTKTYARELTRIRQELIQFLELTTLASVDLVFSVSGTSLFLLVTQLLASATLEPLAIVTLEGCETGSRFSEALQGQQFTDQTLLGEAVSIGALIPDAYKTEVINIASRAKDGALRNLSEIDSEFETNIIERVAANQPVVLILTDQTKTGLIIPSPACALRMSTRFPSQVTVLVDACQLRLSSSTLQSYLEQDFLVAITGSKFLTGAAFSAALLVPQKRAQQLREYTLPSGFVGHTSRSDWPEGWAVQSGLADFVNYGLLCRWESALEELRSFSVLPQEAITAFIEAFNAAIGHRLKTDPAFEPLALPKLDRSPITRIKTWDNIPTIIPFLLRWANKDYPPDLLTREETSKMYELLREDLNSNTRLPDLASKQTQLGQPVVCGTREGTAISALRLCLSARLITDALAPQGRGAPTVIAEALAVLDKLSFLLTQIHR